MNIQWKDRPAPKLAAGRFDWTTWSQNQGTIPGPIVELGFLPSPVETLRKARGGAIKSLPKAKAPFRRGLVGSGFIEPAAGPIVLRRFVGEDVSIALPTAGRPGRKAPVKPRQSADQPDPQSQQSSPPLALVNKPSIVKTEGTCPRIDLQAPPAPRPEVLEGGSPPEGPGTDLTPVSGSLEGKGEEPYFVYFLKTIPYGLKDQIYVKVGISKNPYERKHDIDNGCPYETEMAGTYTCPLSAATAIESALHQHLEADHLHLEWFTYSPKVQKLIERVRAGILIKLN